MDNKIAALALVLLSTVFAGTAAAQPPRADMAVAIERAPRHGSVAPHLADEPMALRAPGAGDYVLPVIGVVFGGAATVAGVIGVLGSGLLLFVDSAEHRQTDADLWLGGSAGLAVVGALSLGLSIAQLTNLHHRGRDAEGDIGTGVRVLQFAPTANGAMVSVLGTF